MEIHSFQTEDQNEIIDLVLSCQNDGSRPLVSVEDQPELLSIPEKFLGNGGGFWVAKENGKVAGCVGLMNCGHGLGILKKFFVCEEYRGNPHHLGQQLYGRLREYAMEHAFKTIILDTPPNTHRAHRFYEKAGFSRIDREELPVEYDYPYQDSDFFLLEL